MLIHTSRNNYIDYCYSHQNTEHILLKMKIRHYNGIQNNPIVIL